MSKLFSPGQSDKVVPSTGDVIKIVTKTVQHSPNMRWWMAYLMIYPISSGFSGIVGRRLQSIGYSPEMFAEYDIYMFPVEICVTMLAGRMATAEKLLTSVLSRIALLTCVASFLSLCVFWKIRSAENPTGNVYLRFAYVASSQFASLLFSCGFVVKCAFITRIASKYSNATATVLTFLNCCSNLGLTVVTGTIIPLVAQRMEGVLGADAGLDVLAVSCISLAAVLQVAMLSKLKFIEDFGHRGWGFAEEIASETKKLK